MPTIGNLSELQRLLDSLVAQHYAPLRVIVVDKSPDGRVAELVEERRGELEILHLRVEPCGMSRAVNLGLEYAAAELIGVPDDDCWYPDGFLRKVARRFAADLELAGLSVRQLDEDGRPSHGRWARSGGPLTRTNVWSRGVGPGIFYRRRVLEAVGPFDETLGVGSGAWEAGLETDLLIRVATAGYRVEYEPDLWLFHPGPEGGKQAAYGLDRWRSYGAAMGHVMRKHRFPLHAAVYHCLRPLLGSPVAGITRDWQLARRRLAISHGRFLGWLAAPDRVPHHVGFGSGAGASEAATHGLPSIDLVVPTFRRSTQLERMLETACEQKYPALRVIVVDQNEDATAEAVIQAFRERLDVVHVRTLPPGASRARNIGIAHVTAELVGFPDDDCWYPDGLLRLVGRRFANDGELSGLSMMIVDRQLRPSNGRWATKPDFLTATNVWCRGCAAGMFIRRTALERTGGFDETMGVGSGIWESGEETDLLIRLASDDYRIAYDPTLYVHHPDPERDLQTTYPLGRWRSYAVGMGHVMRKHRYPLHIVAYHCARPVVGAAGLSAQRRLRPRTAAVGDRGGARGGMGQDRAAGISAQGFCPRLR